MAYPKDFKAQSSGTSAPAIHRPDSRAGVEPSVRNFWEWTPQHITTAEQAANWGNTQYAAALCEWLLGDDRIGPLMQMRVESLLGLTPTFEPSGDGRRRGRATRAMEVEEDFWRGYDDTELAQIMTWGILLGFAPARHSWIADDRTQRVLPCPTFWNPQHMRWDPATRQWMIAVAPGGATSSGPERILTPGDGTWILHMPYGQNRPWIYGLWRALSRLALLKAYALADWARHGEKGALLVGTTGIIPGIDYEVTREQRQALAQDIYDRGREAVAIMPSGIDLKLVESTADTRAIYGAQMDMANLAIAIAIRGGNLTTEVTTGSFAAAQTQERLGDDAKRRFDGQRLTRTLHDQSLVYWAEYNFGDRRLAPWPVYPVDERDDLKLKADTMTKASAALLAFQQLGMQIEIDKFAEVFELGEFLSAPKGQPYVPKWDPTLAKPGMASPVKSEAPPPAKKEDGDSNQ